MLIKDWITFGIGVYKLVKIPLPMNVIMSQAMATVKIYMRWSSSSSISISNHTPKMLVKGIPKMAKMIKRIVIETGSTKLSDNFTGSGVIMSTMPNKIAPIKALIGPTKKSIVTKAAKHPAIVPSIDFWFHE